MNTHHEAKLTLLVCKLHLKAILMVQWCTKTTFLNFVFSDTLPRREPEITFQFFCIFLLLGSSWLGLGNPTWLGCRVLRELKLLLKSSKKWSLCGLCLAWYGKARYSKMQGSLKGDIKQMFLAWMAENNSWDWTVETHFAQFSKAPPINLEQTSHCTQLGSVPIPNVGIALPLYYQGSSATSTDSRICNQCSVLILTTPVHPHPQQTHCSPRLRQW